MLHSLLHSLLHLGTAYHAGYDNGTHNKLKYKNMRSTNLFKRADGKGYIILPRRLMDHLVAHPDDGQCKHTVISAYLYLLAKARYADDTSPDGLRRGELAFSRRELSKVFGWNYRTTTKFIEWLEREEIIRVSPLVPTKLSVMRLLYYDNLCRFTDGTPGGKVRTKKADIDFIAFWDDYHAMTGKPELDIELARANWNRLTARERELATANIAAYCCRQTADRIRTAANYLAHKSFILI